MHQEWKSRRDSHMNRAGMLVVPLTGYLRRFTAGAFAVPLGDWNRKSMIGDVFWTGTTEERKKFKPRPQNRILVPLRVSFQNIWLVPLSFLYDSVPGLKITELTHHIDLILKLIRLKILLGVASSPPSDDASTHISWAVNVSEIRVTRCAFSRREMMPEICPRTLLIWSEKRTLFR